MKKSILLLSVYCFILFCETDFCVADESGGYAGAFLKVGMGVRPLSLGGAFTAVSNDASATYWNPAGLAQISKTELLGTYSIMSLNRQYNSAALALPMSNYGTIGLSWINLSVGNIMGRDSNGQPTTEFSNSEAAYALSYGQSFGDVLYLGGTYKYLRHSLADYNASGSGFDIGLLIKVSTFLRLGITFQDINSKIKWNTVSGTEEKFPLTNRFGISVTPPNSQFMITADYEKSVTGENIFHGGVEFKFSKNFGLNLGYNNNTFAGGGFFKLPLSSKSEIEIQYALFNDKIDVPVTHRISLLYKLKETPIVISDLIPIPSTVIKVLKNQYGVIDRGKNDEIKKGMRFNLLRDNLLSSGERLKIGEASAVKISKKFTLIKVTSILHGYSIEINDKVTQQRDNLERHSENSATVGNTKDGYWYDDGMFVELKDTGTIIKITNRDYGIINRGINDDILEEQLFNLYRVDFNNTLNLEKIGKVKVTSLSHKYAAMKVVSIKMGLSIEEGDIVILE